MQSGLKNEVKNMMAQHTAYKMDCNEVLVAMKATFDYNCFVPIFAIIHGIHFQER
jgi:hypothetical protein